MEELWQNKSIMSFGKVEKKGIYTSWNECKLNTEGIKGAKYKAFLSKAEAEAAYQLGWKHFYQSKSEFETTFTIIKSMNS